MTGAYRLAQQAVSSCEDKLKRAHLRVEYLSRKLSSTGHKDARRYAVETARIAIAHDLIKQAQARLNNLKEEDHEHDHQGAPAT